jgi:hypothetical protein
MYGDLGQDIVNEGESRSNSNDLPVKICDRRNLDWVLITSWVHQMVRFHVSQSLGGKYPISEQ